MRTMGQFADLIRRLGGRVDSNAARIGVLEAEVAALRAALAGHAADKKGHHG